MPESYNITGLLKQLGLKDVTELPLVKAIQPTVIVGEGSALTCPLLPPSAVFGVYVGADAVEYSGYQIRSRGAGGCWVRRNIVSLPAAQAVRFSITPTDPLTADPYPNPLSGFDMTPVSIKSAIYYGSSSTQITAVVPQVRIPNNGALDLGEVFIPNGYFLTVQMPVANYAMGCYVLLQDVESPALAPTG